MYLLDVTECSHTTESPVVGTLRRLEDDEGDVGEIRAVRLLVDGALVETRVLGRCGVDGIHVHDRKQGEENLGVGFHEATVTLVPGGAVQVEAVDEDALRRRGSDVFLALT